MRLGRRQVLAGLAAVPLASLPLTGCTRREPAPPQAGTAVVVVGAGIAGLTAAYDLTRLGHQVVVLEAAGRIGGRVLTVRGDPLPAGVHMEAGAVAIHPAHDHVQSLAAELRLELAAQVVPAGHDAVMCLDGTPVREATVLTPQVQARLEEVAEVLGTAADVPVLDALRTLGLDPSVLALIDALLRRRHGAGMADVSAVPAAHVLSREGWTAADLRVIGGSDQLVERLLDAGVGEVRMNHPVTAVAVGAEEVRVTHGRGVEVADHVVLAVPPALAAGIEVTGPDGPLPPGPPIGMSAETTVLMVHDHPSWVDDRLTGEILAGGPVDGVLPASVPDHPGGLLVVRASGERAAALAELARQVGLVKLAVDDCLPGGTLSAGRPAVTTVWADQPWAGGGRPVFGPGTWPPVRPDAGVIDRRLHHAGDATAVDSPGTVDGAVQSGRRAAQRILERPAPQPT